MRNVNNYENSLRMCFILMLMLTRKKLGDQSNSCSECGLHVCYEQHLCFRSLSLTLFELSEAKQMQQLRNSISVNKHQMQHFFCVLNMY